MWIGRLAASAGAQIITDDPDPAGSCQVPSGHRNRVRRGGQSEAWDGRRRLGGNVLPIESAWAAAYGAEVTPSPIPNPETSPPHGDEFLDPDQPRETGPALGRERRYPPPEQFRGPVVARRGQVERSTTDQRLLDTHSPSGFVHGDPWRVLRIQSEFVEGFGLLAELPRAVTVFGSARISVDDPIYAQGRRLGAALAEAGFAVITGGGPGTMEAVNRGAQVR